MSKKKKIFIAIIALLVILAVPLTVWIAQKQQEIRQRATEGGNPVDVYFSRNADCTNPLATYTGNVGLNDILYLCLDADEIPINSFDITVNLGKALGITSTNFQVGADASRFDSELFKTTVSNNAGNTIIRFAKTTTDPNVFNYGKLQLAKATFTVTTVGSGVLTFDQTAVTSPGDEFKNVLRTVSPLNLPYTVNAAPSISPGEQPPALPTCDLSFGTVTPKTPQYVSTDEYGNSRTKFTWDPPIAASQGNLYRYEFILAQSNTETISCGVNTACDLNVTGTEKILTLTPGVSYKWWAYAILNGNGVTCRTYQAQQTYVVPFPSEPPPSISPTVSTSPSVSPTVSLSPTIPTASPTVPTATATLPPGASALSLTYTLRGIGVPGQNCSGASCIDNPNPKSEFLTRAITVCLYGTGKNPAGDTNCANATYKITGTSAFNSQTKKYTATIALPANFQTGSYDVLLKVPDYLRKRIAPNEQITSGQTTTLPETRIVGMDLNNDNALNLLDYNIFWNCMNNKAACTAALKKASDFNADGVIDRKDLTIFGTSFQNQSGD